RHTRLVSDWSSDVCSSDLEEPPSARMRPVGARYFAVAIIELAARQKRDADYREISRANRTHARAGRFLTVSGRVPFDGKFQRRKIGRASCREGEQRGGGSA